MKQKLNKDNVLLGVKLLTGLKNNDSDDKIKYLIETIIEQVKNYCNYPQKMELPIGVEKTVMAIVVNVLRYHSFGIEELKTEAREKSITRGDTRIDFAVSTALTPITEIESMKPYLRALNRYKRVQMR